MLPKLGGRDFSTLAGARGMARQKFARKFYNSYAWQKCRAAVWRRAGGLCERCLLRGLIVPGVEVHHKIRLTPDTLDDPTIALNPDNLELLCEACHHQEHEHGPLLRTDEMGHVLW